MPTDELLTALAGAWDTIRGEHPEVPPVVLAVGEGSRRRSTTVCLGRYAPIGWSPIREQEPVELHALRNRYADAIARGDLSAALSVRAHGLLISAIGLSEESYQILSEVFITDDALTRPAVEVLGILLHEAAHSLADHRAINETSRQGRYHNARFKAVAEEIGLEGHDRDPLLGWSLRTVTAATAALYGDTIAELDRTLTANRPPRDSTLTASRSGQHAAVFVCGCGPKRRGARRAFKPRRMICGVCRKQLAAWDRCHEDRPDDCRHDRGHVSHLRRALERSVLLRCAEDG